MAGNRKIMIAAAITSVVGLSAATAGTAAADVPPSKQDVRALFDRWNAALATLDPEKVANEYAPDAVLLPTVSNVPRTTRAAIVDYFAKDFLPKKPQGVITQSFIAVLDEDTAAHSGIYDFTLTGADGTKTVVPARFTFVYEKTNGAWKIKEHHSSKMPES